MIIVFPLYVILPLLVVNSNQNYEFSDQLEKDIISRIQSIEQINIDDTIQIFPYLQIKLSNISISVSPEWGYINFNICEYLGFKIYFMFDLLIYYLNENEDGSYSNNTFINLRHPGLIAMIDLVLPCFSIDSTIGWVNFMKGNVYQKEVSFSDMNDYELYHELIEYEKNNSVIINTLDRKAINLINEVLLEFPKCIFQEIFEKTWEVAKRNIHLNLTYNDCEVVQSLTFISYSYVNITRESERLAYNNVTFVINFNYEKGDIQETTVYFEHVFVGFSQFHSYINYPGKYCLGEIVKSLLFASFREIKIK